MNRFLLKDYKILSLALFTVCTLSGAGASTHQAFPIEENQGNKARCIKPLNSLESEEATEQPSLMSWEALYAHLCSKRARVFMLRGP